jgi:DNA-binding response OmpR family regulator
MDRPTRLLLVEDETNLRNVVQLFLEGQGYEVVPAEDGPSGIARYLDSGPFDVAMLDLNLPGCSGVEVCRAIRTREPGHPVLIVSAAVLPEFEQGLQALGVTQWLTKPYHPLALQERIEALTRGRGPAVGLAGRAF